jgi:transcriptional regulator with XRE-family HTH domain
MATILQHMRETAGLTQRELAQRAGITQETLSQLESGKSARPRLDTLTKLRDALELGDLRPEDLLDPNPLDDDAGLAPAGEHLINLLKILPRFTPDIKTGNAFWALLSTHLNYRDLYPARKIAAHLRAAMEGTGRDPLVDLAQYTLMFFDPNDTTLLEILAERGNIGPGTTVARMWCRDVTEAAWIIHQATLTSYPRQVGHLYLEANETTSAARITELSQSVYDIVRARALVREPVPFQIKALHDDPSEEVRYEIAKAGNRDVQLAALEVPAAWVGLAKNDSLQPPIMTRLADAILDRLDDADDDSPAVRALFDLCERSDLTIELAERISAAIDRDGWKSDSSWITSSILAIRSTLADIRDEHSGDTPRPRPSLRIVTEPTERPSWWRRFLAGE